MERRSVAVDGEIRRLKKMIASIRTESEKELRIAKDSMSAAQLAESLVRADYEKLQGEHNSLRAKYDSVEADLNDARRKIADYGVIIKRQQAKIRYLDFKTKEEGDEMAAAFISNFRSVSQADQDSLLQDLFHETRGSKKVLKSMQDSNALLRREVDRLHKKLIEAKCDIDRMKALLAAHSSVKAVSSSSSSPRNLFSTIANGNKRRRISLSDELINDPEWIDEFGDTDEGDAADDSQSSKRIVEQIRLQSQMRKENESAAQQKGADVRNAMLSRRANLKRMF